MRLFRDSSCLLIYVYPCYLHTSNPACPSTVLFIMRASDCGELRPLTGVGMKRVRCPPFLPSCGTTFFFEWIRALLEIAGDLWCIPIDIDTDIASPGSLAPASVRTRKPRTSLRLPAPSGISVFWGCFIAAIFLWTRHSGSRRKCIFFWLSSLLFSLFFFTFFLIML